MKKTCLSWNRRWRNLPAWAAGRADAQGHDLTARLWNQHARPSCIPSLEVLRNHINEQRNRRPDGCPMPEYTDDFESALKSCFRSWYPHRAPQAVSSPHTPSQTGAMIDSQKTLDYHSTGVRTRMSVPSKRSIEQYYAEFDQAERLTSGMGQLDHCHTRTQRSGCQ
jgi:hypothetical protein